MKVSKRPAIPFLLTLDCDCSGQFNAARYQSGKSHIDALDDEGHSIVYIAHVCNKCKKKVWVKNQAFPINGMYSEESPIPYGECETFDEPFIQNVINEMMRTPVMDSAIQRDKSHE